MMITARYAAFIVYIGGLVGTLPNEQHRISGEFYIVDSKTLFIEDFNYDGLGPGECINILLILIMRDYNIVVNTSTCIM